MCKKFIYTNILVFFVFVFCLKHNSYADSCVGTFPNPITDICWECIFPITMASLPLYIASSYSDDQSTDSTVNNPICTCGNPIPQIGIPVSFWEPIRRIEIVREPYCLVTLDGTDLNSTASMIPAPSVDWDDPANGTHEAFYQAHWFKDPLMIILKVILGDQCLDNEITFDVAYMTEFDPLWNDDELTDLLNPESLLFANPVAEIACAPDCVASTTGVASVSDTLFWCGGCNGNIYPLDGNISSFTHGIQGSSLITERMIAKMHRQLLLWNATGSDAMCTDMGIPQPVLQKSNYRFSMLYPVAETGGIISNTCCQPLGASSILWGAGHQYPVKGEDFIYEIYRKRDCCQGAFP